MRLQKGPRPARDGSKRPRPLLSRTPARSDSLRLALSHERWTPHRTYLERQLEEIERVGDLYRDHGLVFTSEVGTLINPTNLRRRSFGPLLERAGLPQIRFHDLRHTCATLLLTRNVHPKYVQELLGHATVAITLDTYSHVIPGMGNHTARAMEDVFS
jgi:integrase